VAPVRHWAWDMWNGWKPCQCQICEFTSGRNILTPLHPSAIGREYDMMRIELTRRWEEKYGGG
jgi:hypothetical protein